MFKYFFIIFLFIQCQISYKKNEFLKTHFFTEKIHWYDYNIIIKVPKRNLKEFEDFIYKNGLKIKVVKEEELFLIYKASVEYKKEIEKLSYTEILKDFPFVFLDPEIYNRKNSKNLEILKEGYKDYESVLIIINELLKKYPNYIKKYILGKTYKNKEIFVLHLTNHNSSFSYKIPIYLNSLHHGNEILTIDYILDMIFLLLGEEYFKIPEFIKDNIEFLIKIPEEHRIKLLNHLDIFLIPMVNPDGLEKFWYNSILSGRKNHRNVDLNRNYPFYWNSNIKNASHSDPSFPTYRGMSPNSEVETQLVISFLKRNPCSFSISYHTYANKILFPYSIDTLWNPVPDRALYFGKQLLNKVFSFRKENYKLTRKLYSVDGTDQDWIYNQIGCIAFLVEGSMNHPPYEIAKYSILGARNIWYNLFFIAIDSRRIEIEFYDKNFRPIQPEIFLLNIYSFENENYSNYYNNRWIFYLGPLDKILIEVQYKDIKKKLELKCSNICREKIYLTK